MLEHKDEQGWTALSLACAMGTYTHGKYLLKHGASASARDSHRNTPLMLASKYGQGHMVRLLLSQRVDDTAPHSLRRKRSRHSHAALSSVPLPSQPTAHPLSTFTSLPCAFNEDGDTSMILAARHNYPGIVRWLLAHQVPCAVPNKAGRTALHEAAAAGHTEVSRQQTSISW